MGKNNKIKLKTKTYNDEVYSLLTFLSKNKYFGEITLYFQNGNVEFIHQKVNLSKSDIKDISKKLEMQKSNSKSNIKKELIEKQLILPLFISNNRSEVIK